MQLLGHDYKFWVAVGVATLFKIVTSNNMSPTRAALTVLAAVFAAWAFTDSVLDIFALNPEKHKIPVAALLALTGEGAMRWVITATPEKLVDLIKKVRS